MKILFLSLSLYLVLLCDTKFSETKYLSALDVEMTKYGIMNLENNILTLKYKKPKVEVITYYEDKLSLQNDKDEIKEYTYEEHPQIEYFGLLLKAIVNNSYESLDNMFTIKQEKNKKILSAKASISGTVDYLEVFHKNKKLSSIIFYMTNKDKITIETIN